MSKDPAVSRKGDVTVRPSGTHAKDFKGPTIRDRGSFKKNRRAAVRKARRIGR